MEIVCLDMEGTLTPEIWERVALNTGIEELGKTTRDIPSYEELMDMRLKIMSEKGVKKYKRDNPGSKLQTAVTKDPKKLKKGSKAWKRRKSFCARSKGWKSERGRAARRRWNC